MHTIQPLYSEFNVRRDLMLFIDYVKQRGLKRAHRDNSIPKMDIKRLFKILKVPEVLKDTELEEGTWSHFICNLARDLGLLNYDVVGVYAGYTSYSESYPDNHIKLNNANIKHYIESPSSAKEKAILNALIKNNGNEFHYGAKLGSRLRFDTRGSRVNAASKMNLPHIRTQLLKICATHEVDKPILMKDFVKKIHDEYPHLILDEALSKREFKERELAQKKRIETRWLGKGERKEEKLIWNLYDSFYESGRGPETSSLVEISGAEKDSFERVEGRYLSYFLEGIPQLAQLVHLEYTEDYDSEIRPWPFDFLKSFTITKKLQSLYGESSFDLDHVKVTITPDYKIFLEATLYPDRELGMLEPFADIISSEQYVTILALNQHKTIDFQAKNPKHPTVSQVLTELSENMPKNIAKELEQWSASADKFIVYDNIGLLEFDPTCKTKADALEQLASNTIDSGNKAFTLVKYPKEVFNILEGSLNFPQMVKHKGNVVLREQFYVANLTKKDRRSKLKIPLAKRLEKVTLSESACLCYSSESKLFLKRLRDELTKNGIDILFENKNDGKIVIQEENRKKMPKILKKLRANFDLEVL